MINRFPSHGAPRSTRAQGSLGRREALGFAAAAALGLAAPTARGQGHRPAPTGTIARCNCLRPARKRPLMLSAAGPETAGEAVGGRPGNGRRPRREPRRGCRNYRWISG